MTVHRAVIVLAAARVALHLGTALYDDFFIDELYYIECSKRLAWGYVDHPPLSIALLALVRGVFGDSLLAMRLVPALAGGAAVWLTGLLAARLGGGRYAQSLAALCTMFLGVGLAFGSFYSMNPLDLVAWIVLALLFVHRAQTGQADTWITFGVVLGFALLNKYNPLFFVGGLAVGMLFGPLRRDLLNPNLWIGATLAVMLFAPHLNWQVANGFPTLEFMRNASQLKNAVFSPAGYVAAQVLEMNPFTTPVWLVGLGFLLFSNRVASFRPLGIAYIAILIFFMAQGAKAYYLAPAYPILFAAGGIAWETWLENRRGAANALLGLVAVGGVALVPFAVPLLPPDVYVRYADLIGLRPPAEERSVVGELPQHLADRHGWRNMVATVARVYQSLPAEERPRVTILAGSYGKAGAINLFGAEYGLPPAISFHNNFWIWGPGDRDGDPTIVIGPRSIDEVKKYFEEVEVAATVVSPWAMPRESNLPVFVARRPRRPLAAIWPELKRFI